MPRRPTVRVTLGSNFVMPDDPDELLAVLDEASAVALQFQFSMPPRWDGEVVVTLPPEPIPQLDWKRYGF